MLCSPAHSASLPPYLPYTNSPTPTPPPQHPHPNSPILTPSPYTTPILTPSPYTTPTLIPTLAPASLTLLTLTACLRYPNTPRCF